MCYKKYMIGSRAIIWVGLLLCLLLLSPSLQAESLDLSTLSTEELLEMYQQNSTERDVLSRELQNTLNIVQNQLQLSLETSDQARQQATEAWMESQKAVISANESKNSIDSENDAIVLELARRSKQADEGDEDERAAAIMEAKRAAKAYIRDLVDRLAFYNEWEEE